MRRTKRCSFLFIGFVRSLLLLSKHLQIAYQAASVLERADTATRLFSYAAQLETLQLVAAFSKENTMLAEKVTSITTVMKKSFEVTDNLRVSHSSADYIYNLLPTSLSRLISRQSQNLS
jgi:hypothetical protein